MRFETDREGLRDWSRYILCRILGHRPKSDGSEWFCRRCGDVLPRGNMARQP